MKLSTFICLYTFFHCPVLCAQTPRSIVGVYIAGKYFLNQYNLQPDHIHPDPISTANTFRPAAGLSYEYNTKSNFVFYGAVEYGQQDHKITLHRDFTDFDPDAKASLSGYEFQRSVTARTRFLAVHVMGGYKFRLTNDLKFCGRIGVGRYLYRGGLSGGTEDFLTYPVDKGSGYRMASVLVESTNLGSVEALNKWYQFRNGINNCEIYFGAEKAGKSRVIQRIDAGIQLSSSILRTSGQYVHVVTNTDVRSGFNSADLYSNLNTTIAIHIGVGI